MTVDWTAIVATLPVAAISALLSAWWTHRRLSPKSTAEARSITAAAIDKDWARFQREIGRLVKRLERAEDTAAQALHGQLECEQREAALRMHLARMEAMLKAHGIQDGTPSPLA